MFHLKSLSLSIFAALVVFGNQAIATAIPAPELNQFTDDFFVSVNPEMLHRQIQPDQTQYKKEWLAIQEVLKNQLVWAQLPLCYAELGEYGYQLANPDQGFNAITDAVFHARHPELKGRKIRPGETSLVNEWNSIYQRVSFYPCDHEY